MESGFDRAAGRRIVGIVGSGPRSLECSRVSGNDIRLLEVERFNGGRMRRY